LNARLAQRGIGNQYQTNNRQTTDRTRQNQTETDRNRQKQTETDRNRQKRTETNRTRQKQTEPDRNRNYPGTVHIHDVVWVGVLTRYEHPALARVGVVCCRPAKGVLPIPPTGAGEQVYQGLTLCSCKLRGRARTAFVSRRKRCAIVEAVNDVDDDDAGWQMRESPSKSVVVHVQFTVSQSVG
jgi:hypothetical protein